LVLYLTEHTGTAKEDCSKQFDLLLIIHFLIIIIFRLFYQLEKYFYYVIALMTFEREVNIARIRRFRLWALGMLGGKLFTYCVFVVLTLLGSTWYLQEIKCLTETGINSQFKLPFWLCASALVCLIYAIRIVTLQVFQGVLLDSIRNEDFQSLSANEVRRQGSRNLTKTETNTIKRTQLCRYDELKRVVIKSPIRPSQQITIELCTLPNNKIESEEESIGAAQDLEFKEDEDEHSKYNCAVCQEEIEIGAWYKKLPKCEHCFHAHCIDQWLQTRAACPMCRDEIFTEEYETELPDADKSPAFEISRS